MAIGALPGTPAGPVTIAQSEVEVVYSEDPDVRLSDDPKAWGAEPDADVERLKHCGWIDVKDPAVISVGPEATRVTVRGLNARELAKGEDSGGESQARLNALLCGVSAIGKTHKTHDIEQWIGWAFTGSETTFAANLLAMLIVRRTKRIQLEGLRDIARQNLAPARPEVVTDAGAPKSG